MDSIDLDILRLLKHNARERYVAIAKEIGLTEGAVRRRVRNMVNRGIIKRFTAETTIEFEGIVLIRTEPTKTKSIITAIRSETTRIFEVSGSFDIAVLVQAYTMEELNQKVDDIRRHPSVLSTTTLIKLKD
jgi:Lrp/AsnC family transcriptional regulator of lysine biosynthesis